MIASPWDKPKKRKAPARKKKAAKKKVAKRKAKKAPARKKAAPRKKAPAKKRPYRRGSPVRSGYANLSGPAVENKAILTKFEPYWDKIRTAAARSIKAPARGFLPSIHNEAKLLGCGAWGCVYQTADKRFALKISLDATEGPVIAKIISRKSLRLHPGVTYFRAIWQLPELFYGKWGNTQAWVILREEVKQVDWKTSRGAVKKDYRKILKSLQALPEVAGHLIDAREQAAYCPTDPECHRFEKQSEVDWLKLLDGLKGDAVDVGKFLKEAYKRGLFMGDVHEGNVGYRVHDLREFGVKRHKKMVVADVGDEDQPIMTEDSYPKVRVIKNPAEVAYWASQIPVL
jgi:hypothetical protein